MHDGKRPVLSYASGYHLRSRPLCDGRVTLENFELKAVSFEEDGQGHEAFMAGKYDAGEFSLANYLALRNASDAVVAIPVFPNRKFRHSYIFVREDSPLEEPAQLKGKKVAVSGWLNTCALWVRGIFADEYGVGPQDIRWVARKKTPDYVTLPAGTQVEILQGQGSLPARLLAGEFDAIIVPDFPREEGWRRLFRDSKAVEQDYYRRTGIFPTSHAITFHKAYLDKHPAAAAEMFSACCRAKTLSLRDDADATFSNFAWNRQMWEEQRAVMGPDPWRYGIKGNEKALETLIRYGREQGLLQRDMRITDLFLPLNESSSGI